MEAVVLYNKILNADDLNWFLLKTNKYKNVNILFSLLWKFILWYSSIWNSGIWNYGEWIDGVWYSGHWLGGKWNIGKIWNNNLHEYFITTLNPEEYYKENNIKQ